MAVTGFDSLLAAILAQPVGAYKTFSGGVGYWNSLWNEPGTPGAGVDASSGVAGDVPTNATAGSLKFTANLSTYIVRISALSSNVQNMYLYDRLWQNSGLSVTTTGAQTVNSTTLTRPDALGSQVSAWLQIYTTLGAGSTAKTISYTDQDGNTGNTGTTISFASAAPAKRTFPFSLTAGDSGIRSIQSFDNVASSVSGALGLILRRRIAACPLIATVGASFDAVDLALPRIYDNACLEMIVFAASASATLLYSEFDLAQV